MPMPLNQPLPQASGATLIRELDPDSRRCARRPCFSPFPAPSDCRAHCRCHRPISAAAVVYEAEGATWSAPRQLNWWRSRPGRQAVGHCRTFLRRAEPRCAWSATGTNGKTSVSQLIAQTLDLFGESCRHLIGVPWGPAFLRRPAGAAATPRPDPLAVQATLALTSSRPAPVQWPWRSLHGLERGRVAALDFDVAVFTNLSRDHLDYHGSMEPYAQPRPSCSPGQSSSCRVINLDDACGRQPAASRGTSRA